MLTTIIQYCIVHYSLQYNLDYTLMTSIIQAESGCNQSSVSEDDEDYGLMQIRQKYSKLSKRQLMDSCTNIGEGARFLANAKKHCKHTKDMTYLVCYNVGVTGASKFKHPKKHSYYKKVMGYYNGFINDDIRFKCNNRR